MKELKEVQKATLEASGQHGTAWPVCFLDVDLSQYIAVYPVFNDKQAALRAHTQSLQAGAVACGWEHGQRVSRAALSVVSLAGAARAT